MKEQTLSREELYNLVWSTPFTALAKKYAISDSGLRKICIKMDVPLPTTSHWVKVKYNKAVKIIELSKNQKVDNEVTLFLREEDDPGIKGLPSPFMTLMQEIIAKEGNNLKVPERLTNPCDLIIRAKKSISEDRPDYSTHLVRASYGELNIEVSQDNIGRALRFMDTFIKVMESRGHRIYNEDRFTYLQILGEKIRIRCSEKLNRSPNLDKSTYSDYKFSPSGILVFSAVIEWHTISWKDGTSSLEEQLAKIIAKLEIKGEELRKETIERELYWAKQHKKDHRKELKEKRKQKEYADFLFLFKEFNRWREAEIIREFINIREMIAIRNNNLTEKMKKQFLWARSKADWYDPLVSAKDKFLGLYDEDTLPSLKDFKQEDNDNYNWSFYSEDYNQFKKSFFHRR